MPLLHRRLWTELYSSGVKYAVAAGSDTGAVGDSFLVQYIALQDVLANNLSPFDAADKAIAALAR